MELDKKELERTLTEDLAVIMSEETDQAFRSKSWAGKAWTPRKSEGIGSLLIKHGTLRRSINMNATANEVIVSSELSYAAIHNEGGTININVTPEMVAFFWKKFYSAEDKKQKEKYKAIALSLKTKKTLQIKIPKRQYTGVQLSTEKKWAAAADSLFKKIDFTGAIKAQIKNK